MEGSLQGKERGHAQFFSVSVTLIAAFLYIWYVIRSTTNVPIMDYWVNYAASAERILSGEWDWHIFWGNGVNLHHSILGSLIFFVEIKWLHGNVWWRMLLGAFAQILTICLLYSAYYKCFIKRTEYKRLAQVLWIPVLLAVLTLNQWEIITQQTSLSFFLRILVYIALLLWYNNIIRNFSTVSVKEKIAFLFVFFVVVNAISQAYFPALFAALFGAGVLQLGLGRSDDAKIKKQEGIFLLLFLVTMILATLLYLSAVKATPSQEAGDTILHVIVSYILDGSFVIAILTLLGSVVLPQGFSYDVMYVWGGIFVVLAIFSALWIFFRTKFYHVTWIPLMMILYGLANTPLIVVARLGSFGVEGMQASRYIVETKWILVGTLLIWAGYLLRLSPGFMPSKFSKYLTLTAMTVCAVGCIVSDVAEWQEGPYRKEYNKTMQNIMLNISSVDDEDLAMFQGGSAEQVREGIEYMKANDLGLFYRLEDNPSLRLPGNTKDSMTLKMGLGADGWVQQGAKLWICTGEQGKVQIKGYCPPDTPFGENAMLTIRLIGQTKEQDYPVHVDKDGFFVVTLENLEPNTVVGFEINSNFARQASEQDTRIISFVLNDIQGI